MLIAFITKVSVWLGVALIGVLGLGAVEPSPASASATTIKHLPYHWKYLAPEWVAPSANMLSQFKTDFIAVQSTYGAGHRGIDYKSSIGEAVYSPVAGTVTEVGRVVFRDVITIQDSKGRLASFEPVCSTLTKGARVRQGQSIGKTCTPGIAYSWHCTLCVHFSARQNGQYISPLLLTGDYKASVLKPYTP